MSRRLHDSLFELYEEAGLELFLPGTRGMKREMIIGLEVSSLTPEKVAIAHFHAVNGWGEGDQCDEWAKPSKPMNAEAEQVLGVANKQLAHCRPTDVVL